MNVQLLGDESRGWAWTRALQGVLAKEIHLCGDFSALRLVQGLAGAMHEPVQVHTYDRFTPLTVSLRVDVITTGSWWVEVVVRLPS